MVKIESIPTLGAAASKFGTCGISWSMDGSLPSSGRSFTLAAEKIAEIKTRQVFIVRRFEDGIKKRDGYPGQRGSAEVFENASWEK